MKSSSNSRPGLFGNEEWLIFANIFLHTYVPGNVMHNICIFRSNFFTFHGQIWFLFFRFVVCIYLRFFQTHCNFLVKNRCGYIHIVLSLRMNAKKWKLQRHQKLEICPTYFIPLESNACLFWAMLPKQALRSDRRNFSNWWRLSSFSNFDTQSRIYLAVFSAIAADSLGKWKLWSLGNTLIALLNITNKTLRNLPTVYSLKCKKSPVVVATAMSG